MDNIGQGLTAILIGDLKSIAIVKIKENLCVR